MGRGLADIDPCSHSRLSSTPKWTWRVFGSFGSTACCGLRKLPRFCLVALCVWRAAQNCANLGNTNKADRRGRPHVAATAETPPHPRGLRRNVAIGGKRKLESSATPRVLARPKAAAMRLDDRTTD